jgi:hypothetical protein
MLEQPRHPALIRFGAECLSVECLMPSCSARHNKFWKRAFGLIRFTGRTIAVMFPIKTRDFGTPAHEGENLAPEIGCCKK